MFGGCGRSFKATARLFDELNPYRLIGRWYVSLIKKNINLLTVEDRPRSSRPETDESIEIEILACVSANFHQSLAEIHQESYIAPTTI